MSSQINYGGNSGYTSTAYNCTAICNPVVFSYPRLTGSTKLYSRNQHLFRWEIRINFMNIMIVEVVNKHKDNDNDN